MRRSLATLVFAVCTTGTFGAATRDVGAQPATVDKQKAKTAKEYVDAGLAAQDAKDFDTAIELYEKAYKLVPHPVLLFNIGQAHRLAGRIPEAVAYYNKYLAADPNGPQAATARGLLAEIEAKKKAAEDKQREDARKAEEARRAEEARKAEQARKAEEARKAADARKADEVAQSSGAGSGDDAPVAPSDGDDFAPHPGRMLKYTGIGVAGVGVLGLAGSIWFGLSARDISDELSQPGAKFEPARVADGEAAERNAIIFGIAGGALIAGGAVLYFLGHRRDADTIEHVAIHARPGFVGFAIGGALP